MSAKQLIETLLARRRLFLSIVGGLMLIVLLISLVWPRTYLAETSVVVDSKSTDPVSGQAQSPEGLLTTIATQVDVIGSHNVALKAVQELGLKSEPRFKKKFEKEAHGAGSIDDWLADYVLKGVTVNPSHESQVVNITAGFDDPKFAAAVANAMANAYIQASYELKSDPARRQSAWYVGQMKTLRTALEEAQANLSGAQQTSGIVGTNSQIDIENTRLSELSSQLINAQAARYESENKLKQMNHAVQLNQLDQMPDVAGNPLLQTLRADLGRAEAKLAETGERYGLQHPEYQSAQAHVTALRNKLAFEVRTAGGGISQAADISARQVAELQTALNAQRDRVLKLKHDMDRLDILKRDVDSAQQAYDSGLARANQVRLESNLNQSNVAILNPAVVPVHAAKPRVLLNVMVALVLGCIGGVAAIIAVEGSDQRVRSGASLTDLTGVVVLSELPVDGAPFGKWPAIPGMRALRPATLEHQEGAT